MNIYAWVALGLIALEILIQIARVGKPRKTPTGADAVYAVIEWAIIAWLVVMAAIS